MKNTLFSTNSALSLNQEADKISVLNGVYSALVAILSDTVQAVERMTLTTCGVSIAFAGWYLAEEIESTIVTAVFFTLSPFFLGCLGVIIIRQLEVRYHQVAHAINRMNIAQRVAEEGVFLEHSTLFPEEWVEIIRKNSQFEQQEHSPEPAFKVSKWATIIICLFCSTSVAVSEIELLREYAWCFESGSTDAEGPP